ncbi:MAG: hypothetical protein ACRC2S_18840 [Waterburya sp.]
MNNSLKNLDRAIRFGNVEQVLEILQTIDQKDNLDSFLVTAIEYYSFEKMLHN